MYRNYECIHLSIYLTTYIQQAAHNVSCIFVKLGLGQAGTACVVYNATLPIYLHLYIMSSRI